MANGTAVSAGDLGGVAATAMAWRVLRGCAVVKEKPEKRNGQRRGDAGEREGVEGVHWPDVAWLDRAEATHGLFSSTRRPWPEGGRPLTPSDQPIQTLQWTPDSRFS